MKYWIKALFVVLIFVSSQHSYSQVGAAQVGAYVGRATLLGDIPDNSSFNFVYGLVYKKQISRSWEIRPSLSYMQFAGSDLNLAQNSAYTKRAFSFESTVLSLGLDFQWNIRSTFSNKKHVFAPYLYGGGNLLNIHATPDFSRNNQQNFQELIAQDLNANISPVYLGLNFGTGFDIRLSKRIHWVAEGSIHLTRTDYIDGISKAANPAKNDAFYNIKTGFSYRWGGASDKDNDGVADKEDVCPDIPGSYKANGCPDRDGDGIADKLDQCPDIVGTPKVGGCPDYDGDGVADLDDLCPQEKGEPMTMGCPNIDTDEDGILDALDQCPDMAGVESLNGCPPQDIDNDGIDNHEDDCPYVFGDAIFNGCPDTDGDGVQDKKDLCPFNFGLYQLKGCSDEQAVADFLQEMQSFTINIDSTQKLAREKEKELEDFTKIILLYPQTEIHIVGDLQQNNILQNYFESQGVQTERITRNEVRNGTTNQVELSILNLP